MLRFSSGLSVSTAAFICGSKEVEIGQLSNGNGNSEVVSEVAKCWRPYFRDFQFNFLHYTPATTTWQLSIDKWLHRSRPLCYHRSTTGYSERPRPLRMVTTAAQLRWQVAFSIRSRGYSFYAVYPSSGGTMVAARTCALTKTCRHWCWPGVITRRKSVP